MQHLLKIESRYLLRIIKKEKTFEIRENDRDYQVNDTIKFVPNDDYVNNIHYVNEINKSTYKIIYVLSDFGLKKNYVALGINVNKAT